MLKIILGLYGGALQILIGLIITVSTIVGGVFGFQPSMLLAMIGFVLILTGLGSISYGAKSAMDWVME